MPGFLAAVGVFETRRWPNVAADRKQLLRRLLEVVANNDARAYIPRAYFDKRLEIVPLRFVWSQTQGARVRERLSRFVLVSWTWFLQPIVAASEPLENLGYRKGACPVSERVGEGMVNLPCNLSLRESERLIGLLGPALSASGA
jgi:hypothetical protein